MLTFMLMAIKGYLNPVPNFSLREVVFVKNVYFYCFDHVHVDIKLEADIRIWKFYFLLIILACSFPSFLHTWF